MSEKGSRQVTCNPGHQGRAGVLPRPGPCGEGLMFRQGSLVGGPAVLQGVQEEWG